MTSPSANRPLSALPEFRRERSMGTTAEEAFRRLTIGDTGLLAGSGDPEVARAGIARLDGRTEMLVRVAALIRSTCAMLATIVAINETSCGGFSMMIRPVPG